MAKIPNLKLSESEVSQTFDLKKILGVDLSDMPEVKDAIAQALIDRIVQRTESGKDVEGNKFDSYSKEYKDSTAFKAFGKTNKVNLTQTGDMLGLLNVIEDKGNSIKIGWDDTTENAKAYNHQTGDTVKKRQFFGITAEEIKTISAEFKPDLKKSKNDEAILSKLDKIAEFIANED